MTLILIAVSILYVGLLFMVARWGDQRAKDEYSIARHPAVYALALGIYCTSWTYFGAVGAASQNGWTFMPIYLGPILLLTLGYPLLKKLIEVSKKQNITSIADFVASRYGKRQNMALVVTLLMTLVTIPYIALQLKAINTSFSSISKVGTPLEWTASIEAFVAVMLLSVFVTLFGAKKADVTEYRSGLVLTIAVESVVKFLGLACSAGIAIYLLTLPNITVDELAVASTWSFGQWLSFEFIVQTIMAAAAFLCLPRQFHLMVVDNARVSDLKTARWMSPLYLLAMAMMIVPIAIVGQSVMGHGINPDTLTMQLPLSIDSQSMAVMVFIGGLSAATAMIIVATLTLGTMWTNEVVMPLLLKRDYRQIINQKQYHQRIISIRRFTIIAILILAFIYYELFTQSAALHGIGLLAFSLVIQILPAIIGGLYWRKAHALGVYAGLLSGFVCWIMFLMIPLATSEPSATSEIVSEGVLVSIFINSLFYIFFSKFARERLIDKIQATAFVYPDQSYNKPIYADIRARVEDLKNLLETFVGSQRCQQIFEEYEQVSGEKLNPSAFVDEQIAGYCERQLAGVLGASSATSMINIVLSGKQLDLGEVVSFFDDTTKALQTNQAILFNSLENLNQGISVVDKELNLVAWNKRYLELFNYPSKLIGVGKPVADLIRFNAERGECGQGELDALVEKRLEHMRTGNPHTFVRRRSDGRIIEMVGNPLPNGGFVTSFTDITRHIETQRALQDANIDLEEHVKNQMNQISEISAELKQAKQSAEQANATKTRFLALASHDILQPLNAARLYLSSFEATQLANDQQELLSKVDQSLHSTEEIISTLLEISRLEQGALRPTFSHFNLTDVLQPLINDISQQATAKGLRFSHKWKDTVVYGDPSYLKRILLNLLSNAVKYTEKGRILLAVRPLGKDLRVQIWDTGAGIGELDQKRIFHDFYRAHAQMSKGLGLGLGVVMRMSEQINAPIKLKSQLGKGSCFSVNLLKGNEKLVVSSTDKQTEHSDKLKLNIWCVDDQQDNLDALSSLLSKWDCKIVCLNSIESTIVLSQQVEEAPDALLIDYQLEPEESDGLELIAYLRHHWKKDIPASLVTAVKTDEIKALCKSYSVNYMSKPVKPARLKAWLKSI